MERNEEDPNEDDRAPNEGEDAPNEPGEHRRTHDDTPDAEAHRGQLVQRKDGTSVPFAQHMTEVVTKAMEGNFVSIATEDGVRLRPRPLIWAVSWIIMSVGVLLSPLPWPLRIIMTLCGAYAAARSARNAAEYVRVIKTTVDGKTSVKVIPHSELKDGDLD